MNIEIEYMRTVRFKESKVRIYNTEIINISWKLHFAVYRVLASIHLLLPMYDLSFL